MAFPFILGVFAVLQSGFNRQIAKSWGLSQAIFLNSALLFSAGITIYTITRLVPHFFPPFVQPKGNFSTFSWWYVLPGLCGFSIVFGLPLLMNRFGAFKVFISIIGAQLFASMLWDLWVENISISPVRVAGALVSLLGAIMVGWKG